VEHGLLFAPAYRYEQAAFVCQCPNPRKRLITPTPQKSIQLHDEGWMDLDRVASVEVTSEEKDYGIDSALVSGETRAGVRLIRELKRSDCSSISRKGLDASR
jgi:hypothetical protein